MNALKPILLVLGLLGALPLVSEGATRPRTSSACAGASGGSWVLGQAPTGCDLRSNAATLADRYPGLVYDENASGAERARWDDYQAAYEAAIRATAAPHAPWYVVPADHKWFARLVVVAALVRAVERLDLHYPEIDAEQRAALKAARKALEKG